MGNVDSVVALINQGANVKLTTALHPGGSTALHSAASDGNVESVVALMDQGAQFDVIDNNGHTPLMLAEYGEEEGHVECIEILTQAARR